MTTELNIADRLAIVRRQIVAAGGTPAMLMAVTKGQSTALIERALAADQRLFGENYVQEAAARWPQLRARFGDVELHLIGALQSNKAEAAVALFDVIQTLDRDRLARELARAERKLGLRRRYCVQVNTGEEPQKAGVKAEDAVDFAARMAGEHGLDVQGLMAIPPADEPPGPHFALLAKLADEARLPWRSMGMSADFEDAVRLGATHVRVGTGVFGPRPRPGTASPVSPG